MERWILALCHERPQLADLRGEWQKKGISVRIVSDVGESAGELSGNTDYAGCTSCRIDNIRGVGYRFIQEDT